MINRLIFYNKKNIEYQQYIPCLDPLQKDRGVMVYSLNPESYGEFLIRLFKKWEEDVKKKHMVYIRQFDNYVGILKGHNPEACDQRGCCGIQYVVEADGSVYPCDFYMLDPYYLGNVNENSFKEMDQARQKLCFMEESLKISEDCLNCRYLPLCRGGCQRNRVKQEDGTYKSEPEPTAERNAELAHIAVRDEQRRKYEQRIRDEQMRREKSRRYNDFER